MRRSTNWQAVEQESSGFEAARTIDWVEIPHLCWVNCDAHRIVLPVGSCSGWSWRCLGGMVRSTAWRGTRDGSWASERFLGLRAGSQIQGLHSEGLWMRWELLWTVILTMTRDCLLFISKEVRDLQTVQGLTGVPKIFCILFPVTLYLHLHLQVHSLPFLARKNLISKPFTECFPGSSACSAL